jgi:hypothetical protein
MKNLFIIFSLAFLVGCASSSTQYYEAVQKAAEANAKASQAKFDALATIASAGDGQAASAAVMALALSSTPTVQPVPQQSEAIQWASILATPVTSLGMMWMQADSAKTMAQYNAQVDLARVQATSADNQALYGSFVNANAITGDVATAGLNAVGNVDYTPFVDGMVALGTTGMGSLVDLGTAGFDANTDIATVGFNTVDSVATTGFNTVDSVATTGFNTVDSVATTGFNTVDSVATTGFNTVGLVSLAGFNTVDSVATTGFNTVDSLTTTSYGTIESITDSSITNLTNLGIFGFDTLYKGYGNWLNFSIDSNDNFKEIIMSNGCKITTDADGKLVVNCN